MNSYWRYQYIAVGVAVARWLGVINEEQPPLVISEVKLSDRLTLFPASPSYERIVKTVLAVLSEVGERGSIDMDIPSEMLDSFGECCKYRGLLDDRGFFDDADKLVELFCAKV